MKEHGLRMPSDAGWRSRISLLTVLAGAVAFGLVYRQGLTWFRDRSYETTAATLHTAGEQVSTWEASLIRSLRDAPKSDRAAAALASLHLDYKPTEDRLALSRPGFIGIFDDGFPSAALGLESFSRGTLVEPALLSMYQAWGDSPRHRFPTRFCNLARELGKVPMITWEPWLASFESESRGLPPAGKRNTRGLRAIARGDYDFHVKAWARQAARHGDPVFLRFAHEMNNVQRYPWTAAHGNVPQDYVDAWRHVHQIFQEQGATQVIWVWSPHAARSNLADFYPGADVVDWVGTAVLNYGREAGWSKWWSLRQMFDNAYTFFEQTEKPVMIAEFATQVSGGDAMAWYDDAFDDLSEHFPAVRMVVFFHDRSDDTVTPFPLDWSPLGSHSISSRLGVRARQFGSAGPVPPGGEPRPGRE